jgi:hypothetical protein
MKTLFRILKKKPNRKNKPYNCARYRVTISKTEEWIANGRQAWQWHLTYRNVQEYRRESCERPDQA